MPINYDFDEIIELQDGTRVAKKTLDNTIKDGRYLSNIVLEKGEGKYVEGFQLRYVYFIDKTYRKRLSVPEIPFTKIDEIGAGMYKGEKITQAERHIDR